MRNLLPEPETHSLIIFRLDDRRYALRPAAVERIARAVEITPLPRAPRIVLGVINAHGRVVPVFDVRARFGLPTRAIELSDHLIIAHAGQRVVALVVDEATGVVTPPSSLITAPNEIVAGLEYTEGVVRLEDGLLFIHDLETFLSADEAAALEEALDSQRNS